ncbi:MAG: hypothetical protein MUE44_08770 [Oscillatoriaceae cyanobacterium Prado104]|nr:hypothetical protein [Oscillatoriaceae cyanobacterium Prado104]
MAKVQLAGLAARTRSLQPDRATASLARIDRLCGDGTRKPDKPDVSYQSQSADP